MPVPQEPVVLPVVSTYSELYPVALQHPIFPVMLQGVCDIFKSALEKVQEKQVKLRFKWVALLKIT